MIASYDTIIKRLALNMFSSEVRYFYVAPIGAKMFGNQPPVAQGGFFLAAQQFAIKRELILYCNVSDMLYYARRLIKTYMRRLTL